MFVKCLFISVFSLLPSLSLNIIYVPQFLVLWHFLLTPLAYDSLTSGDSMPTDQVGFCVMCGTNQRRNDNQFDETRPSLPLQMMLV